MSETTLEGGCACGRVRYRMAGPPMIVHACHCRQCQRETGGAFAENALIETGRVTLLRGDVDRVETPTQSGRGQLIMRCPSCRVALWSHYSGMGERAAFIRVGTLDEPDLLPPDIHIFTASKQPWVDLPPGAPAFSEFYDMRAQWPPDSLERLAALRR